MGTDTYTRQTFKEIIFGWWNPTESHLANYNIPYLNRNHVPCFYRVIQKRVGVWENEKCCGNASRRQVFSQLFRDLPNFHECLYNSIETQSTCFLFLNFNDKDMPWD